VHRVGELQERVIRPERDEAEFGENLCRKGLASTIIATGWMIAFDSASLS